MNKFRCIKPHFFIYTDTNSNKKVGFLRNQLRGAGWLKLNHPGLGCHQHDSSMSCKVCTHKNQMMGCCNLMFSLALLFTPTCFWAA